MKKEWRGRKNLIEDDGGNHFKERYEGNLSYYWTKYPRWLENEEYISFEDCLLYVEVPMNLRDEKLNIITIKKNR